MENLANEITEEQFDTFTRLARAADYLRENRAGNKLQTVIAINRAIAILDNAKRDVVYAIRHQ